jgi:hypothetical protein
VLERPQARGFVGREEDLERLEQLLNDPMAPPVAFVDGPGGVGKSALLRELGRRAGERGLAVRPVDGRDSDAASEALGAALAAMRQGDCDLLLLDTYERVTALGAQLRRDLPPLLEAGGRVVIAGRRPPEAAWLGGEWVAGPLSLSLAPLASEDSRRLLRARGLEDEAVVTRLAAWAEGSPLALSVAADTLRAGNRLDLDDLDADELLARTLVGHLAGAELEQADHDIVAVAAIARAVDAPLLAAAIPGVDGDHAEAWVRSLSFAEPLGTRVTLHERVRKAVRGALLAQDPEHERLLRRRVADHLFGRAALGELRLVVDIAELIENPTIRWGIAPPPVGVRADRIAPGDRERLAELLGGVEGTEWWRGVVRWLDEAPEHVIAVRDESGQLVGWGIWATPASAPPWADEDAILGPWLADAARRDPDGNVLLLRDGGDLVRERGAAPTSAIASAGNYGILLGCGLRSVRYMYATTDPADEQIHEFLLALGYQREPELDTADGERTTSSYVVDWGPGGVVRFFRDVVYHDLGMKPPPPPPEREGLAAGSVRDALRSFHDPVALAANPLGRGRSADDRAASVRETLRAATSAAFGDSPDQVLSREAIERGYLDPEGGHSRAMAEMNVSRTTYFRRLSAASERVAAYVLAQRD